MKNTAVLKNKVQLYLTLFNVVSDFFLTFIIRHLIDLYFEVYKIVILCIKKFKLEYYKKKYDSAQKGTRGHENYSFYT